MTNKGRGLPPSDSCGYQVRATHRVFERVLHQFLRDHGIKPGFWYVLRVLWEEDGITQKELSDRAFLREPSTATMLDLMADSDLIVRKKDETDGRKYRICLTRRGNRLKADLLDYASTVNSIALRGVSETEKASFLKVARLMRENLQEATEGAT